MKAIKSSIFLLFFFTIQNLYSQEITYEDINKGTLENSQEVSGLIIYTKGSYQ